MQRKSLEVFIVPKTHLFLFSICSKSIFFCRCSGNINSGVAQAAPYFPHLSVHPKPLSLTSDIQREEKGGAGSRMFSSEYVS